MVDQLEYPQKEEDKAMRVKFAAESEVAIAEMFRKKNESDANDLRLLIETLQNENPGFVLTKTETKQYRVHKIESLDGKPGPMFYVPWKSGDDHLSFAYLSSLSEAQIIEINSDPQKYNAAVGETWMDAFLVWKGKTA